MGLYLGKAACRDSSWFFELVDRLEPVGEGLRDLVVGVPGAVRTPTKSESSALVALVAEAIDVSAVGERLRKLARSS